MLFKREFRPAALGLQHFAHASEGDWQSNCLHRTTDLSHLHKLKVSDRSRVMLKHIPPPPPLPQNFTLTIYYHMPLPGIIKWFPIVRG